MLDERQLGDGTAQGLAADHEIDRGADLGVVDDDVAHRNRAADGGAEAAAGDLADDVAGLVRDRRVLARGRLTIGTEADAAARGAVHDLAQNHVGTGEAPLGTPATADGPRQRGFDWGRAVVDVVTIQAESSLEAE